MVVKGALKLFVLEADLPRRGEVRQPFARIEVACLWFFSPLAHRRLRGDPCPRAIRSTRRLHLAPAICLVGL